MEKLKVENNRFIARKQDFVPTQELTVYFFGICLWTKSESHKTATQEMTLIFDSLFAIESVKACDKTKISR